MSISVENFQEFMRFLADEDKKEFILDAPLTDPTVVNAMYKIKLSYGLREFHPDRPRLFVISKAARQLPASDQQRLVALEQHVERLRQLYGDLKRKVEEKSAQSSVQPREVSFEEGFLLAREQPSFFDKTVGSSQVDKAFG